MTQSVKHNPIPKISKACLMVVSNHYLYIDTFMWQ